MDAFKPVRICLILSMTLLFLAVNQADGSNNDLPVQTAGQASEEWGTAPDGTSAIQIGLIETGEYLFAQNRLTRLGFSVTKISPDSGLSVLNNFQIIYIPVSWARADTGAYAIIESHASDYLAYLSAGGKLFVDQPNPYLQPGEQVTPAILPYPITFYNGFNLDDYPPIIVDPSHYITYGLDPSAMPFPYDQMITVDPAYTILVIGKSTESAALVVGVYGKGRVLVETSNPNENVGHPISDEAYRRMVNWLILRRIYLPVISR